MGYDDEKSAEIFRRVRERLAAAPGITASAAAWQSPIGSTSGHVIRRVDQADAAALRVIGHSIAGGYFDVLRLPVLAGVPLTTADDALAPAGSIGPIVINATLARQLFGDGPALGQTVVLDQRKARPRTIVGIAADARTRRLREAPPPMFYEPSGYRYRTGTVLIRTALPRESAMAAIRGAVGEVDAALPVGTISTIGEQVDVLIAEERVLARLGLVLAACAGLLAVAGLSAVVAFQVSERTREFGIRLALGGRSVAVMRTAIGRAMRATGVGLMAGAALALTAAQLLDTRLFGVDPVDGATWIAALALLSASAIAAAWLPARRATQVDPTVALRAD
jgi:hypothetical protein